MTPHTRLYRHWHIASEDDDVNAVHDGHLVRPRVEFDDDGVVVVCLDDGDFFWAFPDELLVPDPPVDDDHPDDWNPRGGLILIGVYLLVLVVLVLVLARLGLS